MRGGINTTYQRVEAAAAAWYINVLYQNLSPVQHLRFKPLSHKPGSSLDLKYDKPNTTHVTLPSTHLVLCGCLPGCFTGQVDRYCLSLQRRQACGSHPCQLGLETVIMHLHAELHTQSPLLLAQVHTGARSLTVFYFLVS